MLYVETKKQSEECPVMHGVPVVSPLSPFSVSVLGEACSISLSKVHRDPRTHTYQHNCFEDRKKEDITTPPLPLFSQCHLWTPLHFNPSIGQLPTEEHRIKVYKELMYVWGWVNQFPASINYGFGITVSSRYCFFLLRLSVEAVLQGQSESKIPIIHCRKIIIPHTSSLRNCLQGNSWGGAESTCKCNFVAFSYSLF